MSHVFNDSSTDLALYRVKTCLESSLTSTYKDDIVENYCDKNPRGVLKMFARIVSKIQHKPTDFDKYLSDVTGKLLDIHGLTPGHLDVISRFEDTFYTEQRIADTSIDTNSNKSERTIRGLLSEVMGGGYKLLGYRFLFRKMKELYGTKKAQRLMGRLYDYSLALNDSTNIMIPYCFAMDASSLITTGRQFGQLWSAPTKRLSTYISVLNEVVHQFTNQIAGALAVGTFFMDAAWVLCNMERIGIKTLRNNEQIKIFDADAKTGEEQYITTGTIRKYVENQFQSFIHSMNSLSRQTYESPFTNVSIFSPSKLRGLLQDEGRAWYIDALDIPHMPDATHEEKLEYMIEYIMEVQNIYMDLFDKGDPLKGGINYRFPVTTINVSKETVNGKDKLVDEDIPFKKQISKREIYRYNNMVSKGTKVASCCFVPETCAPFKIQDAQYEVLSLKDAYTRWEDLGKKAGSFKVYQFGHWYSAHPVRYPARYKSIHRITLEDGTILPDCTGDHLHLIQGGVYAATIALSEKDELCIEKSLTTRKISKNWIKIKSIEVINECVQDASYVYCVQFEDNSVEPIFTLEDGLVTHNCRLITDVDALNSFGGQVNSFGGSATSFGSHRVCTINWPRIALEAEGIEDFYELQAERLIDSIHILHAHRELLRVTSNEHLHPFFANGWMSLDRLFSTVGVIGIAETCDILAAKIKSGVIKNTTKWNIEESNQSMADYAENYAGFCDEITSNILTRLNEMVDMYSTEHPTFKNPYNIEEIPGEAMAVRLCDADKLIYGKERVPFELYSNQFIPLWREASIYERMAADGKYNQLFTGGGIVHFNLGERATPEQVEELYDYSVESGCEHFALNPIYSLCVNNHSTFGDVDTCPVCGEKIEEKYTRVVGFFTPISSWSKVRRNWEFPRRKFTKLTSRPVYDAVMSAASKLAKYEGVSK